MDLSSHNAAMLCRSYEPLFHQYKDDHLVPLDFVHREYTSLDHRVFDKHKLFIRTIGKNIGHGRYVRQLTWTILDPNSHTWRWFSGDENHVERDDDEPEPDVYEPEDGEAPYTSYTIRVLTPQQSLFGKHSAAYSTSPALISAGSGNPSHVLASPQPSLPII